MSGSRLRIAIAAEDGAGTQVLRRVAGAGHDIVVVLTGDSSRAPGATVAGVAARLGLPVRPAAEVRESRLADVLDREGVDLLLNVHSLHIVHPDVLRAPRLGAFNLHPGPLPRFAGLNVPCWALYLGEEVHAVTVHRMVGEVDAGDVAYVTRFAIRQDDTGLTLMRSCGVRGVELVDRLIRCAAAGAAIPATALDPRERRWFPAGPPDGGWIDWTMPARRVVGLVRACDFGPFRSPWGAARAMLAGEEVAVLGAQRSGEPALDAPGTLRETGDGAVLVAAGDEWVRVTRLAAREDGRRAGARVSVEVTS